MVELKLKKINKPRKGNVNKDINWFCESLCLSSGRDIDFTSRKIVIDILNKVAEDRDILSEGIAEDLDLKQGLVNHHLRNLIDSGVVVRERKQLFIRGGSLKDAVIEMRRDALSMFEDLEKMAEEIDDELGIFSR